MVNQMMVHFITLNSKIVYFIAKTSFLFVCLVGDDSWFGSEPLLAFGVCDGVGEMSDTQWRVAGFDCRGFGEDILR